MSKSDDVFRHLKEIEENKVCSSILSILLFQRSLPRLLRNMFPLLQLENRRVMANFVSLFDNLVLFKFII